MLRSPCEPSLYVKREGDDILIVCLYVYDLIYASSKQEMVEEFKRRLMAEFEMSDLGLMRYFLGIQVKQSKEGIFISQEKYAEDLLKKFNMINCKPMGTPMALTEKLFKEDGEQKADPQVFRSLVGSLIYLTNTRSDIVYVVGVVSRFMSDPSKLHFTAAKRKLRYVKGTKNFGIRYEKEDDNSLVGYTDSDWAGSIDDRKVLLDRKSVV